MTWRVQWRKRTPNGTPSTIEQDDGWDLEGALFKAKQLLEKGDICWLWVENLESNHRGNSLERPKYRVKAPKKAAGKQPA